MNDEKYIYFTERIQNLLCRPDILKMMSISTDTNNKNNDSNVVASHNN